MPADIRSINTIRADRENDNTLLSPVECLEDAAQDLRSGKTKCDKLLVLRLNTSDHGYAIGFNASHLRASEIVALLEIAKTVFLRQMNFIPGE
jgi:hypothetical protein